MDAAVDAYISQILRSAHSHTSLRGDWATLVRNRANAGAATMLTRVAQQSTQPRPGGGVGGSGVEGVSEGENEITMNASGAPMPNLLSWPLSPSSSSSSASTTQTQAPYAISRTLSQQVGGLSALRFMRTLDTLMTNGSLVSSSSSSFSSATTIAQTSTSTQAQTQTQTQTTTQTSESQAKTRLPKRAARRSDLKNVEESVKEETEKEDEQPENMRPGEVSETVILSFVCLMSAGASGIRVCVCERACVFFSVVHACVRAGRDGL